MFQEEEYQKIIHEIKNSVCIIGSSLQLIEKHHPEVKNFSYWDSTLSDIYHLNNLFTEMGSARLCDNMHLEPVHTAKFLSDVKKLTASLFHGDISCSFGLAETLPDIEIDTICMQHALINLVKNAVEAIGLSGTVQLNAAPEDDCLVIHIKDDGCGISQENMSHLFTPLYSSKENGSGLGLAITKQIVTAHQGTISCSSTLGVGTTFTITLPAIV